MSARHYRILNALLVLALLAGSAWAYPRLPGRIPIHFGLSGEPDRWAARSVISWYLLPAIAVATALGMHAISVYGTRWPEAWNLPEKRRFLALPRSAQAPIIERMQGFLAFTGLVVTALFSVLQAGIYTASTSGGRSAGLPVWASGGILAAVLLIGIGGVRLNGALGRMVRAASARVEG